MGNGAYKRFEDVTFYLVCDKYVLFRRKKTSVSQSAAETFVCVIEAKFQHVLLFWVTEDRQIYTNIIDIIMIPSINQCVCVYLLTQKKQHEQKHRTRQVTSVCCSNSSCLLLVYFRSSFYLWLFMSHCVSQ